LSNIFEFMKQPEIHKGKIIEGVSKIEK